MDGPFDPESWLTIARDQAIYQKCQALSRDKRLSAYKVSANVIKLVSDKKRETCLGDGEARGDISILAYTVG